MKTIEAYAISGPGTHEIQTFTGATVLSAEYTEGLLTVYILEDTRLDPIQARFCVIPVGKPIIDYVKNPTTIHAQTFVDTVGYYLEDGERRVVNIFSIDLPVAK